jgi:hypothetical protein
VEVHSFANVAWSACCRFRFCVFWGFLLIRILDPVVGSGSSVTPVYLAVRRRNREAERGSMVSGMDMPSRVLATVTRVSISAQN